jgi:hypothetical protein
MTNLMLLFVLVLSGSAFAQAPLSNPPALPDQAPTGPHDIEELIPYVVPWWQYALMIGGVLLIAAIIAGVWYWYKNKKKAPEVVVVDHWAELSETVQKMKPDEALANGQAKEFYYQLSLFLRTAIELSTQVRATDMTFRELSPLMDKKLPVRAEELLAMKEFLKIADLVKFADRVATEGEARHFKQSLQLWISALRPRVVAGLPTDLREQSFKLGSS